MGHKKRNLAHRSKQSPAVSAASSPLGVSDCSVPYEPEQFLVVSAVNKENRIEPAGSSYSAVKLECKRALNSLGRGNHTKALKIMKELSQRHENSAHLALVHRVQGTMCVKVAGIFDDPTVKQRYFSNAIESARKAVELSPNSIEFARFYANLLYEAANEGKDYDEVVQKCERALTIEQPVDPAKESLQDESQQKISTTEARIGHVQNELRQLIQKSNISSISTWMKNLGNGEEKFRLIPLRRVVEDPMEVMLVQTRRSNEIQKATKTLEDRRKEIEVRVAAARLLQQKFESPQSQNYGERDDRVLDSSTVSSQRERRKYVSLRKNGSSAERMDWVRSYWNTMSYDMKKELLRIKICDLRAHFSSAKGGLASEVLSEALSYAEVNKSWEFWVCCCCGEKFVDSDSHFQHVQHEHMRNLIPRFQSVIPSNIGSEWIEILHNCSWKPLDISAAAKMLGNQSICPQTELVQDCYSGSHGEDSDDCFKDAWDSSPEKGDLGDSCNGCTMENTGDGKITRTDCEECSPDQGSKQLFVDCWPISEDSKREKLLKRICASFDVLIRHTYLAESHLKKVIQFAMDELQGLSSGTQLLTHGLDQTPACICFLGASQLQKILQFLQDLSQSCGLKRYYEKSNSQVDDTNDGIQTIDIKETIVLNGDGESLMLDERLLQAGCSTTDALEAFSANVSNGNGFSPDADALLSWIFFGPTSEEQLTSWTSKREKNINRGIYILQVLEKEFSNLQKLCEVKCKHLSYEEALQAVEDLCDEEGKKRENVKEFVHRSFESVLRKRREELESENNVMFGNSMSESGAISNVLEEAASLSVNQFGYDETYAGVSSHLCDLESGEDDEERINDYLRHVDTCIEVAIQRQNESNSFELNKIDAKLVHCFSSMQQIQLKLLKLEPLAAYDYRSILLPLVKSYMRAHLEDLAEKEATEKSDAVREAFLAELALDSRKGARKGSDRHTQEKTKDKKKNKEYRKTKDSKATGGSEQYILQNDGVGSFPDAAEGEDPHSEIVSVDGDLKKQEEEFRRKVGLEEQEIKLETTLEYQRRIENEAKQKHLAEHMKMSTKKFPEQAERLHDEQDEPIVQKDEFSNNVGCLNTTNATSAAMPTQSSTTSGIPNGGIPEEGPFHYDRRTRRGRRQKNSTKLINGKYQILSSETENFEVENSLVEVHLKEHTKFDKSQPMNSDSGTKTLRQLHVENEEEKFQTDLKTAVCQSLDTFEARQKQPQTSSSRVTHTASLEIENFRVSPNDVAVTNAIGAKVFGTGLKNEIGEYNCFLNVIIQSLWHLRRFRDEFLQISTSEHIHVGHPCVVCALYDIFTALNTASTDMQGEAVAPTALRMALSNHYPDSKFFQEAQMNDASEVLEVIFDCLHQSFTPGSSVSHTETMENNCTLSWDCSNNACIAHNIFGMNLCEQMNCNNCGIESRQFKYSSYFHNINANALRTTKVSHAESSFDELLNLVEMNHQLACDPDAGGCGKHNYIDHNLSATPHVFTAVLGWQNTSESAKDIKATLAALSTEVDISVLYRGLDPKKKHHLVSVVCYYGQHYLCFVYSHDHDRWIMYDDKSVKMVGGWEDVLTFCGRGHLQPQVLFFEAVN